MNTWAMSSQLSPASSLALKLYAVAAMIVDHVDWLLLDSALGFHDTIGRTVFPLFALLLAINCARGEPSHLLRTVAPRMALVGVVASLVYVPLAGAGHGNVMFTLAAGVAVAALGRLGHQWLAYGLFLLAGLWVDYGWPGLACIGLGAWAIRRGVPAILLPLFFAPMLAPINGSWWALLAFPLVLAAWLLDASAPRWKWLFYAVYPAHLAVLWLFA